MISSLKNRYSNFKEKRSRLKLVNDIRKSFQVIQKSNISTNEPVVLCLFKNGDYFVKSFMDHYKSLGFQNFVFIDNCSDDDSLRLLENENVTILQSELPYSKYKWAFKQFLVHEFGENKWSLYVDIDELWEYPGISKVSLPQFFNYLDNNNYDAVMSYMLDVFADIPLRKMNEISSNDLKATYKYYDNSHLNLSQYSKAYNRVNHEGSVHHKGGVNDKFFGVDIIYLSKIPLVKWNPNISVHETSHTSTFVNIADVSSVLLHYKFVKGFEKKIEKILSSNNYWNASAIYAKFANVLEKNPDLNLKTEEAILYENPEMLESDGSVWISNEYKALMKLI